MYLICSRYWRTTVQIMKLTFVSICFFVMYYTADRLHVAMHLLSNRSQKMSKCGKNISSLCIFLPHVVCDLLKTEKTLARLPRASTFWSWANKIEVQWLSGRVKLDSVVLWVWIKMSACQMSKLKMLHGKKLTALFPWDFKSVFVWHITCKILSFEFYPKAVFFECKFRISRSAIVQVQNWPIRLQRVGSRIRWCPRLTSLKLQRVNAAYCTCKTGL